MASNLIQLLKEQYSLNEQAFDKLLFTIMENEVGNLTPIDQPTAFFIVAQAGVNSRLLEKQILAENPNTCFVSRDVITKYIPYVEEIKVKYPKLFGELTRELVSSCVNGLERFCRINKYNILVKTDLSIDIEQRLKSLASAGYKIEFYVLAVNAKISELNIELNNELQGRINDVLMLHSQVYQNIPLILKKLKKTKLVSKFYLYHQKGTQITLVSNEFNIELYLRDRKIISEADNLKMKEIVEEILTIKKARNLPSNEQVKTKALNRSILESNSKDKDQEIK